MGHFGVMAELPSGTVTFLFTDLAVSTRLWEDHPEGMKVALAAMTKSCGARSIPIAVMS